MRMRVLRENLRVEIENEMRVFLESLNFEIEMRVSQKSARFPTFFILFWIFQDLLFGGLIELIYQFSTGF